LTGTAAPCTTPAFRFRCRFARSGWQKAIAVVAAGISCVCFAAAQQPGNPQLLFNQAVAAQEQGDDTAALRLYRQLLTLHPEAVLVRINLGATLAHLKRFGEAIEQYRIALASDPNNRVARMNLAIALQQGGEATKAIVELELLHNADPEDGQSVLLLADCYVQAGRAVDAVALLSPLEHDQRDDADFEWSLGSALIQAGRAQEGVERVETAANKGQRADAWLLAGQTRLGLSQFDLADKDLKAATELNPTIPGSHTLQGMIQEQTADYDRAESSLLKALTDDPNDFNAHYYLGAIHYFKRDMEKARTHLTRALQLQPESAQARFEMALVELADGQLDAALRDLLIVASATPGWLQPHVKLSSLYYRLRRPEDGAKEKQIVDRLMAADQKAKSLAAR